MSLDFQAIAAADPPNERQPRNVAFGLVKQLVFMAKRERVLKWERARENFIVLHEAVFHVKEQQAL